jgi:hypothetical protein
MPRWMIQAFVNHPNHGTLLVVRILLQCRSSLRGTNRKSRDVRRMSEMRTMKDVKCQDDSVLDAQPSNHFSLSDA